MKIESGLRAVRLEPEASEVEGLLAGIYEGYDLLPEGPRATDEQLRGRFAFVDDTSVVSGLHQPRDNLTFESRVVLLSDNFMLGSWVVIQLRRRDFRKLEQAMNTGGIGA